MMVSAGLSLPAQHVDESWQSAEFFANKVGLVYVLVESSNLLKTLVGQSCTVA